MFEAAMLNAGIEFWESLRWLIAEGVFMGVISAHLVMAAGRFVIKLIKNSDTSNHKREQ